MPNQDYLYHRCLFYMGYEVLQHSPHDAEVLLTTFEQGMLALYALQDLQKDRDLTNKVHELSKRPLVQQSSLHPSCNPKEEF